MTRAARRGGILVFAAAGNDSLDVDAEDAVGGIRWERAWVMPCENDDVICVGGLAFNSQMRQGQSNFGTRRDQATSVDVFAPFDIFVGPNGDNRVNAARLVSGTSFSSPFAAGVAALIWAANPALDANSVEQLLIERSNSGSTDPTVPRWLNSDSAVVQSIGLAEPPPAPPPASACSVPQRFRVALNGFRVNRETRDHILEADGKRDEVFIVAESRAFSREGALLQTASPRGVIVGDINNQPFPPRIPGGSASSLGGLRTGDLYPTRMPWLRGAAEPVNADRPPMLLFDGSLQSGRRVAFISPAVFEWDGPGMDISAIWDSPFIAAATEILRFSASFLSSGTPSAIVPGSAFGMASIGRSDLGRGDHNRPVGLFLEGTQLRFRPQALLLTCEGALGLSVQDIGFGPGVIRM